MGEEKLLYQSETDAKKRRQLNLVLLLVAPWFGRACDTAFQTVYLGKWVTGRAKTLSPSSLGVATCSSTHLSQHAIHKYNFLSLSLSICVQWDEEGWETVLWLKRFLIYEAFI